jgi:LacI family transcriptional regulator
MSITRIAEAANVSYATAWRILNNRPCSSEGAIQAVHKAVRQIGYEPAARGQRRGRPSKVIDGIRTRNVALLHLRPGTPLSTSVLNAVQRRLAERDLNLLFAHVEDPAELPQAVRTANVDGILGYGKFPDAGITPQIERIPAVWMMSRNDRGLDRFGDRVAPDHAAIGQLAAEHLLGLGLRRLAVLNPAPGNEIYRQRCDAFALAAQDRGLPVDRYEGGEGPDGPMADLARRWRAEPDGARGLFVPADELALPLYRWLGQHGVPIGPPDGVSIVSSDHDAELMAQMRPAPVTMDLNHEAIAQQAVERLLWRMRHGTADPQTTLCVRPTLVVPT